MDALTVVSQLCSHALQANPTENVIERIPRLSVGLCHFLEHADVAVRHATARGLASIVQIYAKYLKESETHKEAILKQAYTCMHWEDAVIRKCCGKVIAALDPSTTSKDSEKVVANEEEALAGLNGSRRPGPSSKGVGSEETNPATTQVEAVGCFDASKSKTTAQEPLAFGTTQSSHSAAATSVSMATHVSMDQPTPTTDSKSADQLQPEVAAPPTPLEADSSPSAVPQKEEASVPSSPLPLQAGEGPLETIVLGMANLKSRFGWSWKDHHMQVFSEIRQQILSMNIIRSVSVGFPSKQYTQQAEAEFTLDCCAVMVIPMPTDRSLHRDFFQRLTDTLRLPTMILRLQMFEESTTTVSSVSDGPSTDLVSGLSESQCEGTSPAAAELPFEEPSYLDDEEAFRGAFDNRLATPLSHKPELHGNTAGIVKPTAAGWSFFNQKSSFFGSRYLGDTSLITRDEEVLLAERLKKEKELKAQERLRKLEKASVMDSVISKIGFVKFW